MSLPQHPRRPEGRSTAVVAHLIAIFLIRVLGFHRLISLLQRAKQHRTLQPARQTDIQQLVHLAHLAGRASPLRAACLETSLTTFLLALARGYDVDWCIGTYTHPYSGHAWIEHERTPVAEPTLDERSYLLLLRL